MALVFAVMIIIYWASIAILIATREWVIQL